MKSFMQSEGQSIFIWGKHVPSRAAIAAAGNDMHSRMIKWRRVAIGAIVLLGLAVIGGWLWHIIGGFFRWLFTFQVTGGLLIVIALAVWIGSKVGWKTIWDKSKTPFAGKGGRLHIWWRNLLSHETPEEV